MSWLRSVSNPSTQDLYDLFDNKISCILVENFLTLDECSAIQKEVQKMGLEAFEYDFQDDATEAYHLFDTHYSYEQKTPDDYFPKARENNLKYETFCGKIGLDPALRVKEYLSKHFSKPVSIAEQQGQSYTYAMIRELRNGALLHADFAAFLNPMWSLSSIKAQYAWNIYLTDPQEGGEVTIYDKLWEKEDDQEIIGDTYGYSYKVVENKPAFSIAPKPGLFALFNSRNFHDIKGSKALRLSMGGHAGINDKDEILMWV